MTSTPPPHRSSSASDARAASPEGSGFDPRRLSEAARIRAAADNELPADAVPAGEHAAKQIDFERALRDSVGRSMGDAQAPEALRARVLALMAQQPDEQEHAAVHRHGAHERGREVDPGRAAAGRRPRSMRWAIAAAMVALVGGVAVSQRWLATPGVPLSSERASLLISFMSEEHKACADFGPLFERKMKVRDEAAAVKEAIELLARVPEVLELPGDEMARAGYRFAGLGRCHVPGRGRSAHLIYKAQESVSPGAPPVSLFVQEDSGEIALEDQCSYRSEGGDVRPCLRMWRKDGLVYYLITPQGTPDAIRRAFAVPEREERL